MAILHFNADPYTSETFEIGTNSTKALATGNYAPSTGVGRGQLAAMAFISLTSGDCRIHWCADPATGCGHWFLSGDYLVLDGVAQMQSFQIMNEGNTSTANAWVTYFIS